MTASCGRCVCCPSERAGGLAPSESPWVMDGSTSTLSLATGKRNSALAAADWSNMEATLHHYTPDQATQTFPTTYSLQCFAIFGEHQETILLHGQADIFH